MVTCPARTCAHGGDESVFETRNGGGSHPGREDLRNRSPDGFQFAAGQVEAGLPFLRVACGDLVVIGVRGEDFDLIRAEASPSVGSCWWISQRFKPAITAAFL